MSKRVKQSEIPLERRGKWPAHVAIPLDKDPQQLALPHGYTCVSEYHVSLSAPFSLLEHEIPLFVSLLRQSLQGCKKVRFHVNEQEPVELKSENGTMIYLALKTDKGTAHAQLDLLLDMVDEVMVRFGKPCYPKDRIIHTSVAFRDAETSLGSVQEHLLQPLGELVAERVELRAGHLKYQIELE